VIRPTIGIAPLKYKKTSRNNQILVVPDKEAAAKVALTFELAAQGKSFREILKRLNAEGLRSNLENGLALSSLHNMLTNLF